MSLNQKRTSEILSRLDWSDGLTREEIYSSIHESDDMDTSDLIILYRSLPPERRFHSFEEAVDAVAPMSWEK